MDLYRTEIVGSRVNLLRPNGTIVFWRANTPENRDLFEMYAKRFNDKLIVSQKIEEDVKHAI